MVTPLSRPASLLVAVVLGGCAASTRTVIRPPQAPTIRCADPVEGVWEGEVLLPAFAQWTRLRLEVRREPRDPTRLTGEIVSRYGSADTSGTGPSRCTTGAYDRTVRMTARGTVRGNHVSFAGTAWRPDGAACGGSAAPGSYALDRLDGTLDSSGLQIHAVDSDGDHAIEAPVTLWRTGCVAPGPTPP